MVLAPLHSRCTGNSHFPLVLSQCLSLWWQGPSVGMEEQLNFQIYFQPWEQPDSSLLWEPLNNPAHSLLNQQALSGAIPTPVYLGVSCFHCTISWPLPQLPQNWLACWLIQNAAVDRSDLLVTDLQKQNVKAQNEAIKNSYLQFPSGLGTASVIHSWNLLFCMAIHSSVIQLWNSSS